MLGVALADCQGFTTSRLQSEDSGGNTGSNEGNGGRGGSGSAWCLVALGFDGIISLELGLERSASFEVGGVSAGQEGVTGRLASSAGCADDGFSDAALSLALATAIETSDQGGEFALAWVNWTRRGAATSAGHQFEGVLGLELLFHGSESAGSNEGDGGLGRGASLELQSGDEGRDISSEASRRGLSRGELETASAVLVPFGSVGGNRDNGISELLGVGGNEHGSIEFGFVSSPLVAGQPCEC